jgi:hypothetical protein
MKTLCRLFSGLVLALFAVVAQAQFSPQQIATLKAACTANQTCAALTASQSPDDIAIAAWFNAADEGGCIVWRPDVSIGEANAVMVWTEIDTMAAGKARIWEWMRLVPVLDFRQSSIRQGINDAFAGLTTRVNITQAGKRTATRAEKALASGSCSNASPSFMTWFGSITFAEASLIRA